MKKGSDENKQSADNTKADVNQTSSKRTPGATAQGKTTSQNSTSSSQMSGGATPVQGMNQSREQEQDDLRE